METSSQPQQRVTNLPAPRSARYLSDFLLEGLPQNCLFDKALTGCGGTYVALTCDKPYIVAVPTKALVKDKVENPTYLAKGLIGISEDYPLEEVKDKLPDAFKIIVTYKSLPSVCELLDISRFHLLVDEAHMLINMTSYARPQLKWILESFKSFKSYCFMSATIPRNAHLLPEIAVLDRINVIWDDQTKVEFECYISDHIMNSILKIVADHKLGKRSGTPYFFYNTISGICKVVDKLRGQKVLDFEINVICASTKYNLDKLRKVGLALGHPNHKADVHFITATAFEGVDFYDPEGVTYIVSDKDYTNTKYPIETTIPQIAGRLRDSKYNDKITIIFNKHNPTIDKSPREFELFLLQQEKIAKYKIERYKQEVKSIPEQGEAALASAKLFLKDFCDDPYIQIEGTAKDFEDLVISYEMEKGDLPEVEFYPYASVLAQHTYDVLHEERFVRGDFKAAGDLLSLGKLKGLAPVLDDETAELFKSKPDSLKTICKLFEDNPMGCSQKYPEWFSILTELGVEVCKAKAYRKKDIKALYEKAIADNSAPVEVKVAKAFKIGGVYTMKQIKDLLVKCKAPKTSGAALKLWFEVQETKTNGKMAYRVIRKL